MLHSLLSGGFKMLMTTISSRDFNQHISHAKKAAQQGAVFITDRGNPSHVLLSFADYQKLVGHRANIIDLLASEDDIEFEPPRLTPNFSRPVDFG